MIGSVVMANRPCQAFDVARQRRVVLNMVAGVLAHDVHDRRLRTAGVMQVRQAVGQARSEMQERHGRFVGHTGVTVGRPRNDAFEQPKDAAHPGLSVQCGDKMHFRRARIGETYIHIIG